MGIATLVHVRLFRAMVVKILCFTEKARDSPLGKTRSTGTRTCLAPKDSLWQGGGGVRAATWKDFGPHTEPFLASQPAPHLGLVAPLCALPGLCMSSWTSIAWQLRHSSSSDRPSDSGPLGAKLRAHMKKLAINHGTALPPDMQALFAGEQTPVRSLEALERCPQSLKEGKEEQRAAWQQLSR